MENRCFKEHGMVFFVLLTQTFPTGIHHLNIPDNGILAQNGAYISAFTGSSNQLTIFLS